VLNYWSNDSGDDINTNKKLIIKPEALINKPLFSEINPEYKFSSLSDIAVIKLKNKYLQKSDFSEIPQMFTLDRDRKSIFYSVDMKNLKEFSIQVQTKDPATMAVSKDGFIFVSDIGIWQ
jgi:hypothetical protein